MNSDSPLLDVEQAVKQRYSAAAQAAEAALCCSVEYDRRLLDVLPAEIRDRDYGCGDPSRHVRAGETVLDLGSGAGQICYIASQIVGPQGRVIGIDMNVEMLALARKYQTDIGRRIGWHNVDFRRGRIQDLALDLEQFDLQLHSRPVQTADDWFEAKRLAEELRIQSPMVASNSVDAVLSNCVLNLVDPNDRRQLFREVFRVLRPGGRAIISDIVSDKPAPAHMRNDPDLWSGCISGAFVEHEFARQFEQVGFCGTEITAWHDAPWATVEGIEFRSVTVSSFKPPATNEDEALAPGGVVVYRGPWKSVVDDDGTVLHRGVRTPVSGQNLTRYGHEPFAHRVIVIPPPAPGVPEQCQASDQPTADACCGPGKCR